MRVGEVGAGALAPECLPDRLAVSGGGQQVEAMLVRPVNAVTVEVETQLELAVARKAVQQGRCIARGSGPVDLQVVDAHRACVIGAALSPYKNSSVGIA